MGRMIDADKLKKDVLDLQNCYNGFSDTYDKACIIGVIDEQPSAQPERKKGKWIVDALADNIYRCSECGVDAPVEPTGGTEYKSNFCPNCGADMRGEQDG